MEITLGSQQSNHQPQPNEKGNDGNQRARISGVPFCDWVVTIGVHRGYVAKFLWFGLLCYLRGWRHDLGNPLTVMPSKKGGDKKGGEKKARKKSAYMFFCADMRAQGKCKGMTVPEQGSFLGGLWEKCKKEGEHEKYEKMAAEQ